MIYLDEINCQGTEDHILGCQHSGLGVHNCVPGEDVGVVCAAEGIYLKNLFAKPLASTPTCYLFAAQVTAKW